MIRDLQVGLALLAAHLFGSGCQAPAGEMAAGWKCENLVTFDSHRGGRSNVILLDLESHTHRNLTAEILPGAKNWLPDLAPGGERVVFVSQDSLGVGQLYVLNTDGSGLRQLTLEPATYENPAWSTDGEWIAFERRTDAGWALYIIRPDGTELTRIGPEDRNLFHPSWAPDGQRMVVVTGSGGEWVAGLLSLDSHRLEQLTPAGLNLGSVKWSPDGATIALDGMVGDNIDLYLLTLATHELTRLTQGGAVDARPEWSPDGKKLVFHSTRDQGGSVAGEERWEEFELYVLDLATGSVDRLTRNDYFDAHPDWCWPASEALAGHTPTARQQAVILLAYELPTQTCEVIHGYIARPNGCDPPPGRQRTTVHVQGNHSSLRLPAKRWVSRG